jgi:hypothetical protein
VASVMNCDNSERIVVVEKIVIFVLNCKRNSCTSLFISVFQIYNTDDQKTQTKYGHVATDSRIFIAMKIVFVFVR